jgi:hypothetical protein
MKNSNNLKELEEKLNKLLELDEKQTEKFEEIVLNTEFAQLVKQLMRSSEYNTREKLATKLDISQAHLSKLFSGKKYFNVPFLAKIQRVFNMRIKVVDRDKITTSTKVEFTILVPVSYNEQPSYQVIPDGGALTNQISFANAKR